MDTETASVVDLAASECWSHLRSTDVGRLAVNTADGPDVFPLTYLVDHGTLVFRSAPGTKLAAIERDSRVAFEVDGYSSATNQAWSIVIRGAAVEIREFYEALEATALPPFPWQQGPKRRFVRITPVIVTGRRFAVAGPEVWKTPLTNVPRAPIE